MEKANLKSDSLLCQESSSDPRFRGIENLVGSEEFRALQNAHVCIIGAGGVGSWAAEALARSGIGTLTLVDLDDVCITNINRQVQATSSSLGTPKIEALASRLQDINPSIDVNCVPRFFSENTVEQILSPAFDLVIDGIDRVTNKSLLIATCVSRALPIVTTGSAGERLDPTKMVVVDLARTIKDPLLAYVRKHLRQHYGFPRKISLDFGVPCVYAPLDSQELPSDPNSLPTDKFRAAQRLEDSQTSSNICEVAAPALEDSPPRRERDWFRSCNDGLGSAAFVTGAFGFAAASVAVKIILSKHKAATT